MRFSVLSSRSRDVAIAILLIGCSGATARTVELKSVLVAKSALVAARAGDAERVRADLAELRTAPPNDAVSVHALVELWERFEDYRGESGPVLVEIGPAIYPFLEPMARYSTLRARPVGWLVADMGPRAMPKILEWVSDENTAAAGLAALSSPELDDEVARRAPEILETIAPYLRGRDNMRSALRVVELIGGEHAAPVAPELIALGNYSRPSDGICGVGSGQLYRNRVNRLLADMGMAALPPLLDALGGDHRGSRRFAYHSLRRTPDPRRSHFRAELVRVLTDPTQIERHEAAREATELLR